MDYQIDYDLLNKYCNADLCVRLQGTLENDFKTNCNHCQYWYG